VLAGPSVATCFNSSDGMGVCLRGKMTDAGLLGPQPTVAAQPSVTTQAPEVEVAVATPQLDVTPPAEVTTPTPPAAVPDGLVAATFGLLRAEPDGSVVIAGSGTPGSQVEVYSNGELLGTAEVEPSGDWVLVPDEPIAPGGTELTLAENGKQGQSAESFVVVINDDKTSEPLVVASTPGQASEILQGLARPDGGRTTDVAVADPVTPPVPTAQPAAPAAIAAAPAPTPTPTPTPAPAPSAAVAPPAAPSEPAVETPAVAAPAQPTPTAPEPSVAAAPVEPSPAPAASAEPTPTPAVPDQQVAVADPVQPTPAAPAAVLANVPPTIDAIEIEEARNFFAGGGPDGAIMRLYVDGQYIADATVEAGRWLVESANVLTKPTQRIRIDMLTPGSADVAARAEVDFVVDLPEPETPTAVATAEPTAPPATPAPVAPTAPAATADATPTTEPSPQPSAAVVEPAPTAQPAPATTAEAPAAPEPAPAPQTAAAPSTEPVTAPATPVAPAQTAVAPQPPAPETAPTAVAEATPPATEPASDADVPTLVAVAVGEPGDQRFASGKAIIRRGDNLWTIARRVYGQGIKYTTIYAANDGQIRNPNRIYPGQVFDLPTATE